MKKFWTIMKWIVIVAIISWFAEAAGCTEGEDAYIHSQSRY